MGSSSSREHVQLPTAVTAKFSSMELHMLRKSFSNLAQRSPGKTIDKDTFLQFFPLPGLHGERLFEVFDHKVRRAQSMNRKEIRIRVTEPVSF